MVKEKEESKFLSKVRAVERWFGFQSDIKWTTSAIVLAFHALAAYWCYNYAFPAKWQSVVFGYLMYVFSGFGITGGAHRYWTHRGFKAATPLRVIFLLGFASANQNTLYQWVRNHRIHHKYSDTEADPHNINRGFFFSHIGWLLMKKKPEVVSKFSKIDMSDIENDPLITWHTKYVDIINPLACFVFPTLANMALIGEGWRAAVAWQCFIRLMVVYHVELTVNSLAHSAKFGYEFRPYNRNIKPVENGLVSALTGGEGWHNYHHAFPYDYKAAEWARTFDFTTHLLHWVETFGWLTDKREASKDMIQSYINRQAGTEQKDIIEEASY
ncbi:acyl-CoA Delta-9 desaturase-like [Anticarsia gemmatalis]|uniref:acyl-CoA Delta-9 desaturase-like n=1 Tax=Anticarsia gemmatalis TaxID=129554 RepID=UPI003F760AA9